MRFTALLLAIPLVACGGGSADAGGQGPRGERSYKLSGFTRVVNAAPAEVRITTGGGFDVVANGNQKLLDRLEIDVVDGTLRIRTKKDGWNWGNSGSATIEVAMPRIEGASIVGAGDMTIDRGTGNFAGEISGAGDLTIGRVEGGNVSLNVSGAGDVAAAGTAQTLNATVAGAGSVRAKELTVRSADVEVAGAGSISATVDGDARVSIAGLGSVDLGPRAKCTVSKSGLGSVTCG
ncbi:head GIN domain-containing protein [Sphingomonas sp. Y38-1Y]|uniref:head GIN domain-containing protein n=1 Tax=Sphingomonas sp. Y38-1Y TaxID=3078265 RepID=UPI0028E7FB74|nr:head GIN domain-containing protein [Sphingomonas sp. Y38-1Y]